MTQRPRSPEHESATDSWLVDRLLAGSAAGGSLDAEDAVLVGLFDALTAPATAAEMAGLDAAAAAFVAHHQTERAGDVLAQIVAGPTAGRPTRSRCRRYGGRAHLRVVAAAYGGVLPPALPDIAHRSIGAPAAHQNADPTEPGPGGRAASTDTQEGRSTPTLSPTRMPGPAATGPAALGLCQVFVGGHMPATSTAYRSLAAAAGTRRIAAYCDGVLQPRPAPRHTSPNRPSMPGPSSRPDPRMTPSRTR